MKLRALNPIHWITSVASGTAMPLLAKELNEQASRKRTYVLRTVYALLLFTMSAFFLYSIVEDMQLYGFGPWSILGRGKEMLATLLGMQFVGVYLFLPAMVSNAITHEKERNSLTLLMLTDLRPWEVILQKLISRIIPMLTFVMLSLPLMALAYAFGGIEAWDVVSAVLVVVLACLQVSACAIMASAYARSTAGAFLMTYVVLAVVYFVMPVVGEIVDGRPDEEFVWCLVPPFIFARYVVQGQATFGEVMANSIPSLISVAVFLIAARVALVRRAMVPPGNWWLSVFRKLDSVFNRANKRMGGITLLKDRETLPDMQPVAWRELTKKAMAKPAYLIRILLLIEVPILLLVMMIVAGGSSWRGQSDALSAALFILWPIAALMICVQAGNLFAAERGQQTLDVLLTTPLTTREILTQKMASLRRLWMLLAVPFLTIFLVEAWWEHDVDGDWNGWYGRRSQGWVGNSQRLGTLGYLAYGFLSVLVYMPMLVWFSTWIGMRTKSQARAIIMTLGGLVAWCLVPMMIIAMISEMTHIRINHGMGVMMALSSPMTIVPFAEFNDLNDLGLDPVPMMFLNFAWYGFLTLILRSMCFANADRWLGRVPDALTAASSQAPTSNP